MYAIITGDNRYLQKFNNVNFSLTEDLDKANHYSKFDDNMRDVDLQVARFYFCGGARIIHIEKVLVEKWVESIPF